MVSFVNPVILAISAILTRFEPINVDKLFVIIMVIVTNWLKTIDTTLYNLYNTNYQMHYTQYFLKLDNKTVTPESNTIN